jgi:putative tryptophan/tyrosine transport system substrate-binding protein
MRRRDFVRLLSVATATAWPLATRAQQPAMPVIGFLAGPAAEHGGRLPAFRQGLSEAGFTEGGNVSIEYRVGEERFDQLPALAAELVRRQVNVLAAGGIPAAIAAKAATAAIPIVFFVSGDPVKLGLVARMNRPGNNVTGVTSLGGELSAKRLELARELVPKATAIALLVNPTNPNTEPIIRDAQAAARSLGLQLHVLRARTVTDIDASFADTAKLRASALVVGNDGLLMNRTDQIAALGLRHAMPTIFQTPEFAAAGGLMSYGASNTDAYRQVGIYAGRILKGEKPGDLPVVQSTKIELIVNLKTAKTLGLAIPLPLLGRADEVIE